MNGFQMEEFRGRILLKQEMEGNGDDAAPQTEENSAFFWVRWWGEAVYFVRL